MEVKTAFYTDMGNVKKVNQDSLSIKVLNLLDEKIIFAVVCDGMGGLEQGELASKEVVLQLDKWFQSSFLQIVSEGEFSKEWLNKQWEQQIEKIVQKMKRYGKCFGVVLGTTVSALLIYQKRYYICHVGDSRIYEVREELKQLTTDHTLVAQEIRMGRLTQEESKWDARRNVLLQCIGTVGQVHPQLLSGKVRENTTFVLCTDGFVHRVSEQEMLGYFEPEKLQQKEDIEKACRELTQTVRQRGEEDNITVVGIVVR